MNQPATARQRPQRPSAPVIKLVRPDIVEHGLLSGADRSDVRPNLSFQIEPFVKVAQELPPLFIRHYEELAENKDVYPLDPDWDKYFALDISGILRFVTVRSGNLLVGYISNLVSSHLHSKSTLVCEIEMFWLEPVYRYGWNGIRMFRYNDDYLKSLGVKLVHVSEKLRFRGGKVGLVFKRLGYRIVETNWGRVL